MILQLCRYLTLGLVLALPAFAETERADQQKDASRRADDGNRQQLQPAMMGHIGNAAEHLKKAKEARQEKKYEKAEEEERKAQMEQMKAQQLQQQMQANDKSARANDAGVAALRKDDTPTGSQAKTPAAATTVISLRIPESFGRPAYAPPEPSAPSVSETTPEVVDLTGFPAPVKSVSNTPSEESSGKVEAVEGDLTKNALSLNYDDSAKGGGTTPVERETGSEKTSVASWTTGGSAGGGGAIGGASGGGGSSGSSADFWNNVGKLVDESNEADAKKAEKEESLSLKKLRGDTLPGAELGDEAFWKKVGKLPARCEKIIVGTRERAQCLHTARRDMQNKWRAAQSRPVVDSKSLAKK